MNLFAVCAPGIETLLANELAELGIGGEATPGGVLWSGTIEDAYRANLHLRTASRVVVRIARFRARSFIELERHARRIDWSPFVASNSRVRLRVTSRKSRLYHERGIAERFGRWIGEDAGVSAGESSDEAVTPGAGEEQDDEAGYDERGQLFLVRIVRDECVVSVDSSGALLHRRGYRQALGKAPLRETLAASMILAAGWRGAAPLLDPLCGAGTIPIEAALIARRIPPGLAMEDREPRPFAFQQWSLFDEAAWWKMVSSARDGIAAASPVWIRGSDRDAGGIEAARGNAARAGVGADIEFTVNSISAVDPPSGESAGLLVTNPPYGVRVGESHGLRDLYATLGGLVRTRLPNWRIAMLSADERLERQMGLDLRELLRTNNGGIPVRVVAADP